jgi:nucleoside-diphosphate-sugar epimerase
MVRIFLAGASGVLGVRLVPLLVADGHVVAGMTRSPGKAEMLRGHGAEPIVCDVYDEATLRDAVVAFRPELVMHQLTDLPDDEAGLAHAGDANPRMRREGTRNLLAAAEGAGASRFLAQSVAWELTGSGGAAKDELERTVLAIGGIVLRYGRFYGPGTYHAEPPEPPRVEIDDAARQTAALLDAPSGVVEVVEATV